jgi:hypothetical protein
MMSQDDGMNQPQEKKTAPLPVASDDMESDSLLGRSNLPVILGAALAAAVGGAIWGAVAYFTKRELGILALAMGWLTATAVLFFSKGRRTAPYRIIAVVFSLAGILVGKYTSMFFFLKDELVTQGKTLEFGQLFSPQYAGLFFSNISQVLNLFDLLWVGLAVYTAWNMLRPDQAVPVKPAPGKGG